MIELQTFLKYEKQLRNLQLHESRLQRRYQKESAELRHLQKERATRDEQQQQQIESAAVKSARRSQPADGFEFSTRTHQPSSSASCLASTVPSTLQMPEQAKSKAA